MYRVALLCLAFVTVPTTATAHTVEVYDASGSFVGNFGSIDAYTFMVEVEIDGTVALLRYVGNSSPVWYSASVLYPDASCTPGTGRVWDRGDENSAGRLQNGTSYVVGRAGEVYRFDLTTSSTSGSPVWLYNYSSAACESRPSTNATFASTLVGSVSTDFPFHIRKAAPSAFAVPGPMLAVLGIVVGGLGAAALRRFPRR